MSDENITTELDILINNDSGNITRIIIEPWAEEIFIKPGDKVHLHGIGPISKAGLELEYQSEILIIYAWQGSKLSIKVNDLALEAASKEIEAI